MYQVGETPNEKSAGSQSPEFRFVAVEGALSATRDWIRSLEKAVNALVDAHMLSEDSPAWIELKQRVKEAEAKLDGVASTTKRTELAIVGTFDDSGTVWKPGIREKVESVDTKVDGLSVQVTQANKKADRVVGWAVAAVLGIWTLVAGVILAFANNYFGWWTTIHAAKAITGGH